MLNLFSYPLEKNGNLKRKNNILHNKKILMSQIHASNQCNTLAFQNTKYSDKAVILSEVKGFHSIFLSFWAQILN